MPALPLPAPSRVIGLPSGPTIRSITEMKANLDLSIWRSSTTHGRLHVIPCWVTPISCSSVVLLFKRQAHRPEYLYWIQCAFELIIMMCWDKACFESRYRKYRYFLLSIMPWKISRKVRCRLHYRRNCEFRDRWKSRLRKHRANVVQYNVFSFDNIF